jgi:predicted ATPase
MNSTKNLFVITGAPGSGKTPIVRELIALGFNGVDEAARADPRSARRLCDSVVRNLGVSVAILS